MKKTFHANFEKNYLRTNVQNYKKNPDIQMCRTIINLKIQMLLSEQNVSYPDIQMCRYIKKILTYKCAE